MGLLYGRAGRLTAENGGFGPGQWADVEAHEATCLAFSKPGQAAEVLPSWSCPHCAVEMTSVSAKTATSWEGGFCPNCPNLSRDEFLTQESLDSRKRAENTRGSTRRRQIAQIRPTASLVCSSCKTRPATRKLQGVIDSSCWCGDDSCIPQVIRDTPSIRARLVTVRPDSTADALTHRDIGRASVGPIGADGTTAPRASSSAGTSSEEDDEPEGDEFPCSACGTPLIPPAGAPRFRCPDCKAVNAAPVLAAGAMSKAQSLADFWQKKNKGLNVKRVPAAAAAAAPAPAPAPAGGGVGEPSEKCAGGESECRQCLNPLLRQKHTCQATQTVVAAAREEAKRPRNASEKQEESHGTREPRSAAAGPPQTSGETGGAMPALVSMLQNSGRRAVREVQRVDPEAEAARPQPLAAANDPSRAPAGNPPPATTSPTRAKAAGGAGEMGVEAATHEIACCDPDHEGDWGGEWDPCRILADHGDTVDVRDSDGDICAGVPRRFVRPAASTVGGGEEPARGSRRRRVEVSRRAARPPPERAPPTLPLWWLSLAPGSTKTAQGWPKLWANFRALIGISSQSVGPSLASWANPVQCSGRRRSALTPRARPHDRSWRAATATAEGAAALAFFSLRSSLSLLPAAVVSPVPPWGRCATCRARVRTPRPPGLPSAEVARAQLQSPDPEAAQRHRPRLEDQLEHGAAEQTERALKRSRSAGAAPEVVATVRAAQGLLSALTVFLCKFVLYGVFVWARRALNSQKRRFPARVVRAEARSGARGGPWGTRGHLHSASCKSSFRLHAGACTLQLRRLWDVLPSWPVCQPRWIRGGCGGLQTEESVPR
jgi:LSD1 subclass zinc finger protein